MLEEQKEGSQIQQMGFSGKPTIPKKCCQFHVDADDSASWNPSKFRQKIFSRKSIRISFWNFIPLRMPSRISHKILSVFFQANFLSVPFLIPPADSSGCIPAHFKNSSGKKNLPQGSYRISSIGFSGIAARVHRGIFTGVSPALYQK